MSDAAPLFLRVEKGALDVAELGALTALFHARLTAPVPPASSVHSTVAQWRRTERRPAFTDPRAWTATAIR